MFLSKAEGKQGSDPCALHLTVQQCERGRKTMRKRNAYSGFSQIGKWEEGEMHEKENRNCK